VARIKLSHAPNVRHTIMRGVIVYDEKNSPLFGLHPTFQAQQPLFEYHGFHPCLGVVPVFTGQLLHPLEAPWLPKLPNYERLQFVCPRGVCTQKSSYLFF